MITVKEHRQFLKDSKHFIISFLSKLFERIPLGSVIVRCSSIFNPANLFVNELDNFKRKMKKLLNSFVESNIMTASKCDYAISQFFDVVNNDLKKSSVDFHNFRKVTDRFDVFYFQNLCFNIKKAKELHFVLKLIFTVSHGNASVERGFSVNNLILENNMKVETIIAHRFVKDFFIANELWPHIFEINNDLILSVKKARGRYQQELEKKKSYKEKNDKEKQFDLLQEEIDVVKKKISDIQKGCSVVDEEFVNSMMQAEKRMIFCMYIRAIH